MRRLAPSDRRRFVRTIGVAHLHGLQQRAVRGVEREQLLRERRREVHDAVRGPAVSGGQIYVGTGDALSAAFLGISGPGSITALGL